jgi:hypothetical protein
LAVDRKETSVSDSYLGATEGELLGAPLARRLAAYGDRRRLFPHQGPPHDDEPACLLTGSRWFTGINQARRRMPVLRTWSCAQVSAS